MALVRNITSKVDIPHEEGHWMVLRKLTGKQLRVARELVGDNALDKMRRMGGEVFKAINELPTSDPNKKKKDPLSGYDLDSLLKQGIASWSYVDDGGKSVECTEQTKTELDSKTERWAATTVLKLSDAPEFQTEDEEKNA